MIGNLLSPALAGKRVGMDVLTGTPGHEVVNHKTDGSLHRYEIAAACRGNAGAATRHFALAAHDTAQAFIITRQPG